MVSRRLTAHGLARQMKRLDYCKPRLGRSSSRLKLGESGPTTRVVSTNLASAPAVTTETAAVTGCPVHWVADLATSAETAAPTFVDVEGAPNPKEVREFFELYKEH